MHTISKRIVKREGKLPLVRWDVLKAGEVVRPNFKRGSDALRWARFLDGRLAPGEKTARF